MSTIFSRWFHKCKSRLERRLDKKQDAARSEPEFTASNIHYDVANRDGAISAGGIGAIHLLARRIGLIRAIDEQLHLLKFHLPYSESDHVLNIADNALCGGTCLQDIEQRRQDEHFLDALGSQRLPDPTTAGDFCRRFQQPDLDRLIDIFNEVRAGVWKKQAPSFFDCAILDMDGCLVETSGACKAGMDLAYDGTWGYHPLVLSLANTGEVLAVVNRPGNRPSHEGAAREVFRALDLFFQNGFRKVLLRGDTDFSQTRWLDYWNDDCVRFIFGYDAMSNLKQLADELPAEAWQTLQRPLRQPAQTQRRGRRTQVKEHVVKQRQFTNVRLRFEEVAEFDYRPTACATTYRMVVVRKNLSKEKGEQVLFEEERYFFYITNERQWSASEIVFSANDRCDQENLLAQLKGGCRALHAPLDNLKSNAAYMLMTALAWNLKAWWALMLPVPTGRWQARHQAEKQRVLKMEFKTFLHAFVLLPCQIIKTGRKLVYRLLGWNRHLSIFFRLLDVLRH